MLSCSAAGSTSTSAIQSRTGRRIWPRRPARAPRNVVFIVWDDVGYATMDCFGGPVRTPTMTRVADMGVR